MGRQNGGQASLRKQAFCSGLLLLLLYLFKRDKCLRGQSPTQKECVFLSLYGPPYLLNKSFLASLTPETLWRKICLVKLSFLSYTSLEEQIKTHSSPFKRKCTFGVSISNACFPGGFVRGPRKGFTAPASHNTSKFTSCFLSLAPAQGSDGETGSTISHRGSQFGLVFIQTRCCNKYLRNSDYRTC